MENETDHDYDAHCDLCGHVFPGEESENGCPVCGAAVEDLTFDEV